MATVRQLARELNSLKEELKDKEIRIKQFNPNDNSYEFVCIDSAFPIKFYLKDPFNLDKTDENVLFITIE